MSDEQFPSIVELCKDGRAVDAAIRRAVREAVLAHARAGNPVAEWRDGQVVWVQPAEVFARLAPDESQPPATE